MALRPPLTRGMPFSFALRNACRFPLTCQCRPSNSVPLATTWQLTCNLVGRTRTYGESPPSWPCPPSHAETEPLQRTTVLRFLVKAGSTRRTGKTRTRQCTLSESSRRNPIDHDEATTVQVQRLTLPKTKLTPPIPRSCHLGEAGQCDHALLRQSKRRACFIRSLVRICAARISLRPHSVNEFSRLTA